MFVAETHTWYVQILPYPSESLSHYMGRFCRANCISTNMLAKEAGVGHVLLSQLQKLRFNSPPTLQQLEKIGKAMGLSLSQVQAMMPSQPMKLEPVRLCAACYQEAPCHQMHWQYKATRGCSQHGLQLLPRCPHCRAPFRAPNIWGQPACQRCGLPFAEMERFQQPYV